jgi:Uncharacterized conserved protein
MCFTIELTAKKERVLKRYGKIPGQLEIFPESEFISGFAFPLLPVITDALEVQAMNWGLIPYWIKDNASAADFRKNTLNARCETIFEKPSFKSSIQHHRCLLPVTGFYEWRHEDTKKIKYIVRVPEQDIFSLGCIYSKWTNPENGEVITSFAIITTAANPLMVYVHNTKHRMPLIIAPEHEHIWTDYHLSKEESISLMVPFDQDRMRATIIP